jgi:hypothetical protein
VCSEICGGYSFFFPFEIFFLFPGVWENWKTHKMQEDHKKGNQKVASLMGVEPMISCLEGRRVIHVARHCGGTLQGRL